MGKVIPLRGLELEPREDVVAFLEDLIERAEAGEIRGVAVAISFDGARWGSAYKMGDGGVTNLVTGLEDAKLRIFANEVERRR
jgi:hypothetical protein